MERYLVRKVNIHVNLSVCLHFFHLIARKANLEQISIYSNKFFHNFHLSESSFTCPGLRASGLAQRLKSIRLKQQLIVMGSRSLFFILQALGGLQKPTIYLLVERRVVTLSQQNKNQIIFYNNLNMENLQFFIQFKPNFLLKTAGSHYLFLASLRPRYFFSIEYGDRNK